MFITVDNKYDAGGIWRGGDKNETNKKKTLHNNDGLDFCRAKLSLKIVLIRRVRMKDTTIWETELLFLNASQ